MKVLFLIDYLDSGGAQRQLCMLAMLLKMRGFDVEIFTYYKKEFYRFLLEKHNIKTININSRNKLHRILAVRKAIRGCQPDVVISFLKTPNVLAELSGIPSRKFNVIVSERNTDFAGHTLASAIRFFLHRFADAVVPNSYAQKDFITKNAPYLRQRTKTIINCVDLNQFQPCSDVSCPDSNEIRLLVLGRFHPQKNALTLISALKVLEKECPEIKVVVDWYGNNFMVDGHLTRKSDYFLKVKDAISQHSLGKRFRLHDPQVDVVNLYHKATALCLPSLYEGCSNVICEAMACGIPVLASNVGDNDYLIEDGVNGFIFDPISSSDIAKAIKRFYLLPESERKAMGKRSRERACNLLSPTLFVEKYVELIEEIRSKKQGRITIVPNSIQF